MTRLLHIQASPNDPASISTSVALDLVSAFSQKNPQAELANMNVWSMELPAFDATMIAAKFAVLRTQAASDDQQRQWAKAVAISDQFNQADILVFSLPMWNFGIPYRLKHFIDVVTLPGKNWSWSKGAGYLPLLHGKRAVLIYSSAGDYPLAGDPEASNADFQKPYMRQWLRFIGVDVVGEIVIGPTLADPDSVKETKAAASARAVSIAATL
jgi:FMN-dependent NADH-azoreductase